MRYATLCSGIEAPTVALHTLGWEPLFFSEIEEFPKAVLAHHYPQVPDLGDMTRIGDKLGEFEGSVDVLIGGTPCQSFSIAGLRGGLGDNRGNLALEFMRIVSRVRPAWVLWENVPGVLSSGGGRDFGSIVGALEELGYGWSYRTLDAQFFGVPQRRRRVFLVGHSGGDCLGPRAVLFERDSMLRDTAPRSASGQKPAASAGAGADSSVVGGDVPAERVYHSVGKGQWSEGAGSIRATGRLSVPPPPVALAYDCRNHTANEEISATLQTKSTGGHSLNYQNPVLQLQPERHTDEISQTVKARDYKGASSYHNGSIQSVHVVSGRLRRLTPLECERLQGFPDNYTLIPYGRKGLAPDTPRYKAIGNSMAVPVVRWIGEGIAYVDALMRELHGEI